MDDVDLWIGILAASRDGDVERVRELLDRGADVNSPDILAGYTPLHFAIEARSAALLRLLIDRGADIEHHRNTVYQTPLGTAVLSGQTELVRILLAAGADPDAKLYPDNQSLVDAALEDGHLDIADLLLSHKQTNQSTATNNRMNESGG